LGEKSLTLLFSELASSLFPCLAYIIDMYVRTDGAYGVNEGILSSAIAALTFALFSVQPLTIVGGKLFYPLSPYELQAAN
jgi:hypothetical protein